ncbi:MAG: PAS domain S-box protein [Chromatiales bacterium]|nr:MAG: PAS domain S-box protein [Chromatiales bacterium]
MTKGHSLHLEDHSAHDCAVADMQMLLEATGVGTWSYDSATHALQLDRVCREMFDLADDDVLDMDNMRKRIHPDDVDHYWQAVTESMRTGNLSINYRIVRKDGTVRFISGRARTAGTADGTGLQIRGVCIDISDRRELEQRLRSTESRMQDLADSIPGLFSFIDRDYRVVFMSSMYREIFERSHDELLGQHMAELVGEEEFRDRKPRYDAALAGETLLYDANRRLPDGTELFYRVSHQPYRDEKGAIKGVMSLALDITERKRAEQALQHKSEELARSNHDLEQFAYIASHDLKAPLRAIEALGQWLQEDLKDYTDGEVQTNLGLLRQRTQRLNRLLDDLMEYSRAGRRVGSRREVNTREMVQDIATLLAPPPSMRVEAGPTLPTFDTHHAPLEQVLRNLINNAIKHHPTQRGHVRVSAVDQGKSLLFAVQDDGEGIPEDYAEKVFQMFQTLQPRDEREGSGMGLAIVQRIIDWQGGRVWFHAGPGGVGTVFKFVWQKNPDLPGEEIFTETEEDVDVPGTDETRQHSAG